MTANKPVNRPMTLAISAMGGQGGGVLADWLIKTAEQSGFIAQSTSVPGVAQRTGSTVYYLEFFPRGEADQQGQDPVMALMPAPGDVDILVAGELVEAGRAVTRGFVTPDRTTLITSTHRDYALSEKMEMGDGRADTGKVIQIARDACKQFIGFDMAYTAEINNSVISSVLLGAIAGSEALPFQREVYEASIRLGGKAVESNLAAFAAGYDNARQALGNKTTASKKEEQSSQADSANDIPHDINVLLTRIKQDFPKPAHETLIHAIRKLVDYQDIRYADEYLDRLNDIRQTDMQHKGPDNEYRLTIETARYLALWMTMEDGIRVADLKTRSARFRRVRDEVRAKPDEIIQITEFFHPRVEEVCDALPAWLGAMILNSKLLTGFLHIFCSKGRKIRTTSLSGFVALYCIGRLKRWRRGTYRYQREKKEIEIWLKRIQETAPSDYALAVEIVECQRLIKGYGDTYVRGLNNFHTIMGVLDRLKREDNPAAKLKELREAALADEFGNELAATLKEVA